MEMKTYEFNKKKVNQKTIEIESYLIAMNLSINIKLKKINLI